MRLVPISQSTEADPPTVHPPVMVVGEFVPTRILDFDMECVAAGFADPSWVPKTVTAWAFSWIGSDEVVSATLDPAYFYNRPARRTFLEPLFDEIEKSDMVTGHNLLRFDLPTLEAEARKIGLRSLPAVRVQDTIRMGKTNGFKKGQDNLAHLLGVKEKVPLNWAQWEEAYGQPGQPMVRERVETDVMGHKQVREEMLALGWVAPPRTWHP